MLTDIKHQLSEDGLQLTSSALIHGEYATITMEWDDEATAEENYHVALTGHENQLQKLEAATDPATIGHTYSVAKHLVTLFGRRVDVGYMTGQRFDEGSIALAGLKLTADLYPDSNRPVFGTLHRESVETPGRILFGMGLGTWAAYLSIANR
jgi:hypothetical protein